VLDFNERRQLTDQNKQRSEVQLHGIVMENWEISKPLLAESHEEDNGHWN
jgi:hypothetical protein